MKILNPIWEEAKQKIEDLTADFDKAIKKSIDKKPGSVKKSESGKYKRIQINMEINGYGGWLLVYQSINRGVVYACYVIFNEITGTCYKRDLLELQDDES